MGEVEGITSIHACAHHPPTEASWLLRSPGERRNTTTPHVPVFEYALFRPDINGHSMLINAHTHLTYYPSQKQWLQGMRGETGATAQSPIFVLRRAPTLSDEQRQQRVGRKSSLSVRALAEVRERETSEKLRMTFQGPSTHSREGSTQGLICTTRPNHWKLANAVSGFTFASIRMYDNRLTK